MDPISIVLGTKFLEEGVKFLWGQAGKIIERYHARKEKKENEEEKQTQLATVESKNVPEFLESPAVFVVDFKAADEKMAELMIMKNALLPYIQSKKSIDPSDKPLKNTMDTLQTLIETIYNCHFRIKEDVRQNIIDARGGGKIKMNESVQSISTSLSGKNRVTANGEGSSVEIKKNIQKIDS